MLKQLRHAFVALAIVCVGAVPGRSMPIPVPQDIIFVFDASGSLGSSGFQQEIDFMIDLINNEIGDPLNPARIGAIRFATTVSTIYNLTDDQTLSVIQDALNNSALLAEILLPKMRSRPP